MWIKLHLATLVSRDYLWLCVSRHWAKCFDSRARKNKSILLFFVKRKIGGKKRNEDIVERNGSPSAAALLDPYAELRGRKYPQFSVIRLEAAYPVGLVLVELIGHH